MSEPLVLRGVRRIYRSGAGELPVLRGADLMVHAGEIVALVAPSGAGKSTLLHLAGLLEQPDGGSVLVEGRDAGALSDAERTAIRRDYDRLRLSVPPSAGRVHRAGERRAAADDRRQSRAARRRSGRMALLGAFGLAARAAASARASCRAASSSGWRSRARWPTRRKCCWPTSRPAISMSGPPRRCSRSCCAACASTASRR